MDDSPNPVECFKEVRSWIKRRWEFHDWLESVQDKIPSSKHSKELEKIIGLAKQELRLPAYDCSELSCHINCGSVCCHFSPDMVLDGVLIDTELVAKITSMLKARGLDVNEYMVPVKWSALKARQKRWFKENYRTQDYVFKLEGVDAVCKTATNSERHVPPSLIYRKSHTMDGLRLWVGSKSVACSFLKDDGKCLLGDTASAKQTGVRSGIQIDLRPRMCTLFMCSTGYMLYVMACLGLLNHSGYAGKSMRDLVALTENVSILLTRFLLTDEFRRIEDKLEAIVSDAVLTYPENRFRLNQDVEEFQQARLQYDKLKEKSLRRIKAFCFSPA
ncbi:MAG: hypothetical protein ABH834_06150 [Candidatus Altiarchaeota archaeon]